MQRFIILALFVFLTGQSEAAVLGTSASGAITSQASPEACRTAANIKECKVTSGYTITTAMTWGASDPVLSFGKSGLLTFSGIGALDLSGANVVLPDNQQVFAGTSGAVTGLEEATPDMFGGKGDNGTTDNGPATINAINAVVVGGTVVIPPASGKYAIKTPVVATGKSFTLQIDGTLSDMLTSFTSTYTDLTTTGKGVIALSGGSVTIKGRAGADTLYGGLSVGGVNQTGRPFVYIYNATGVNLHGIRANNLIAGAIHTYKCTNIRDIDGYYPGGEFTVLHSGSTDVEVDGGRFLDNRYGGLTIHDRGGFPSDGSVLALQRPTQVVATDNIISGTYASNAAAVGLTADNCDYITVANNQVDGVKSDATNTMTMAYSFAGSSFGTVSGNTAKKITVTANGAYTYTGIGMEVDAVSNIDFTGNIFFDSLMGYLVANAHSVKLDGIYKSDVSRESIVSTGAGQSAYVVLANSTTSSNITISGNTDGGSYVILAGGNSNVEGLHINNLHSSDYFSAGFNSVSGAQLSKVTIDDMSVTEPAVAKSILQFADNTLNDITVQGLTAKAASAAPATGKYVFKAFKEGGNYVFCGVDAENYDGMGLTYAQTAGSYIVTNSQLRGLPSASSAYFITPGSATKTMVTNVFVNGVGVQDRGSQAKVISASGVPSLNASFIGQQYIDTGSLAGYIAVTTGTGASDWKKTTP